MIKRDSQTTSKLTQRQRLTIVAGTSVSMEAAASMEDGAFDYAFFQKSGIASRNLKVAGLNATQLKERGVNTALDMRSLGFSSIDLVNASFCASCVSAFGADDVVAQFVHDASDAVLLAGSSAVHALGLDVCTLLMLCVGQSKQAHAVLQQTPPRGGALYNVPPDVLLDAGLRAKQLVELGYSRESVARQTRASAQDLAKLEF